MRFFLNLIFKLYKSMEITHFKINNYTISLLTYLLLLLNISEVFYTLNIL